jgi:hypothetical protein
MNFNGTFMENFKFNRGVIIKNKVQNSKKQVKTKICKETKTRPKLKVDLGSQGRSWSVGLIQGGKTLDPMAQNTGEHTMVVHARACD